MRPLRSLLAVLPLLLAACVTEQTGVRTPEPNLVEAAKANTSLGVEYARQGQNEIALEKIQRALQQNEDYAPAHAAAALIYARRGDDEEAVSHFRRALSLDPHDSSTRSNYGVFLCEKGKAGQAEELLLDAAKDRNYAGAAKAWTDAGICARRSGHIDKAGNYLRQALQLTPDDPEALLQMASLSAEAKDWLRVRAFLQRRERVAKPTAESLRLAIQAERELGDSEAAESYRQQLRRSFPEDRGPG